MKRINTIVLIILVFLFSCGNQERVKYNAKFDFIQFDSLREEFIVVCLVDTLEMSLLDYKQEIYTKVKNNTPIYIVDLSCPDNKWLNQLFLPQVYPVNCVFNNKGYLIDMIPGNTIESYSYLNLVLNTKKTCEEFHFNQNYGKSKLDNINYFNEILKIRKDFYNGYYDINKIDSMDKNFYNHI